MCDHYKKQLPAYESASRKYLPKKIKILFVAESPPHYEDEDSAQYFYFEKVIKAELLFYTLIKAIYDVEFKKSNHSKTEYLKKLKTDEFYLMDTVSYPINKDIDGEKTSDKRREKEIRKNVENFKQSYNTLKNHGHITEKTRLILIKKTVFNELYDFFKVQTLNNTYIPFPGHVYDNTTVKRIKEVLKKSRS